MYQLVHRVTSSTPDMNRTPGICRERYPKPHFSAFFSCELLLSPRFACFLLVLCALFECWRRVCCGQSLRSGFGVSMLLILSLLIQLFRRVSCGRSLGSEFPRPSFTAFFALDFLKQLRRQAIDRLQISLQKITYCHLTISFPYWDPLIAD